jgi:amino acid transporter
MVRQRSAGADGRHPQSRWSQEQAVKMDLPGILLGRRLANREIGQQKIGILAGVAAIGLDGLSSSAYGPEAALTILRSLGPVAPLLLGTIMAVILVLPAALCFSYRQTIEAYPVNGGAYTVAAVARENLGADLGIVAAAALVIDYG